MHGRVIEDRAAAMQSLLDQVRPRTPRMHPPALSIGMVLATEVCASCDVPEFAASMRDGYAVNAGDLEEATELSPVILPTGGCLPAEIELPEPLLPGQTVRVLTGAPVPSGANCVVADERVQRVDGGVAFSAPAVPSRHVRPAGTDLPLGTVIAGAGACITPQLAAIMVRARLDLVSVISTPTASVFAIGNELADPFTDAVGGRMPADNMVMTTGLLGKAGVTIAHRVVLPDDVECVASALAREPLPDLIVTTGGTGSSERDVARRGAEMAGFTPLFGSVAIRPGKGLFAAVRGSTLLLGIPGPPGAVFACLHAFLPSLVARLRGLPLREPALAKLQKGLASRHDGEWLVPCARMFNGPTVEVCPFAGDDLAPMMELALASGVLVIPPKGCLVPGDAVEYLTLGD